MRRLRAAHAPRPMSASAEHYLRAIAELREERGYARVIDIATRVGVTKGTVSLALGQLAERGLIRFDPAHFPLLTPAGRRVAADVRGRYAILHALLTDVLGITPAKAAAEACRWEHVVSHDVANRLLDLLRFAGENPGFATALAEFKGFRRSCGAGALCDTCRAHGPVEGYCLDGRPLALVPRDAD